MHKVKNPSRNRLIEVLKHSKILSGINFSLFVAKENSINWKPFDNGTRVHIKERGGEESNRKKIH